MTWSATRRQRKAYDEARELYGSGGGMPGGFGGFGGGRGGGGGRGRTQNFSSADSVTCSAAGQITPASRTCSEGYSTAEDRAAGGGSRRQRRGSDIESEVTLSFRDALNGVTLPLRLATEGACQTCLGTGAEPGRVPRSAQPVKELALTFETREGSPSLSRAKLSRAAAS